MRGAGSRSTGVARELILHLDDDDRLASEALKMCTRPFADEPELEVLFLRVLGFGLNADKFNQTQASGTRRVAASAQATSKSRAHDLVKFDDRLFAALLREYLWRSKEASYGAAPE